MRSPAILSLTAMALTACMVCGAGNAQQAKGGQKPKSAPQSKGAQPPKQYPPFKIKSASAEIVEVRDYHRDYHGVHSGMIYNVKTSGKYETDTEKRTYKPPESTKWTFRTKINGYVKSVEFKPVSSKVGDIRSWGRDYYTDTESFWTFTPVEEGKYEIVATAAYMDEVCASDTIEIEVLPKRDWAAPISLFNNREPVSGGVINAGKKLVDEYEYELYGLSRPLYAQGPVCVEWLTKQATGSFLDKGGDIRYIRVIDNNNYMSLAPGKMPDGTYTLSIPCKQEEPDGKIKTVTHKFTVNVGAQAHSNSR